MFGGLGGEALYIDTCGGLVADRLADIVSATVQHCHYMAREETQQGKIKIVVFPGFIFYILCQTIVREETLLGKKYAFMSH